MEQIRDFGILPDGRKVQAIQLAGGGLRAEVLTWGAVLRDLRLAGHAGPLVLGLNSLEDYLLHSRNFGATLGRCANRIAGGRFQLDGRQITLDRNEAGGRNSLHGGPTGLSRALWRIEDLAEDGVTLAIRDADGNGGFPGAVDVRCEIGLKSGALCLRFESRANAPTPVNIAHHSYFNLGAGADIRDHSIRIAADQYLPVDADKIPSGGACSVTGTPFDLRQDTLLAARLDQTGGFDHNFCLSTARVPLRPVAWVHAPSGVALEVATTEPGVQFFTAPALNCPVPGHEGRHYGPAAGLCLETQIWPDAVNQPGFPEVVLRPGAVRVQETEYRFFH